MLFNAYVPNDNVTAPLFPLQVQVRSQHLPSAMEGGAVQHSEEPSVSSQEKVKNQKELAQNQEQDSGEEWDSDLETEGRLK